MALADDLERIAGLAAARGGGRRVSGVLAAEATPGDRVYLCALEAEGGERAWIAIDHRGEPVRARERVREASSIAALCEIAEESAFPGDLDELRGQLVQLRIVEAPPGIEEAEQAVAALQHAIGAPPHVATVERLDAIGAAARRLEAALYDHADGSPFTAAMRAAQAAVDALWAEIDAGLLEA